MGLHPANGYSGVAVGCFVERETDLKHQGYSVLGGFSDACNFPTLLSEKLGPPPSVLPNTLEGLITFVYNLFLGEQAIRSEDSCEL